MRQRGIVYDVGRALNAHAMNWRPDYTPELVRRELEIIRTDLNCTAVRLCGRDLGRLLPATEHALELGLDVWFCPEPWGATPSRTLTALAAAAEAVEPLRKRWPDRVTFSVGNELTVFMRGLVPGRTFTQRARTKNYPAAPLREFLADAVAVARHSFHGPVSYCALAAEKPDWELFDVVGVNLYSQGRDPARYEAHVRRLVALGKPVAITELGFPACRDAQNPEFLSTMNAKPLTMLGSYLHLMRPRVRKVQPRDEEAQATLLIDQLRLLERCGVDGAFVMSFSFPLAPYDPDPRFDIDSAALSLVRSSVPWQPKVAFGALADYYEQLG